MNDQLKQEMVETAEARIEFYRFLASIYKLELTTTQIESLAQAKLPCDETLIGKGYSLIASYLRKRHSGTRQELAVDYAHTFLGAGEYDTLTAPPYESVYTSEERILMQDARDGAVRYYRSEGLGLPSGNTTPEDHISFELQFMALLIERSSKVIHERDEETLCHNISTQQAFFKEHLANWVPSFVEDILKHAKTDFYRGVAYLTQGFLDDEKLFFEELVNQLEVEAA